MAQQTSAIIAFNRGRVSPLGLARIDQKRVALSAETMTNWIPRVLGSMSLRPGMKYLGSSLNGEHTRLIPFIFSTDDTAILEFANLQMRVWVNDSVVQRPSVGTTVTNSNFTTSLAGWTDADEAGGISQWTAGGYMDLLGSGVNYAIRRQQVTVAAGDMNKEHALRVVVTRGPVEMMVGISAGDDSYVSTTTIDTGEHSLAFIPTGNFWIQFQNMLNKVARIDSCVVETNPSGLATSFDMTLPTPYPASDITTIRYEQSGDIVFLAADGDEELLMVQRRSTRSWSLVKYRPDDGPFLLPNITKTTLTPSNLFGNITLTASRPLFTTGHVGALFQLNTSGQRVRITATAENTFTEYIRITGVDGQRPFRLLITGLTGTGSTVTLQKSIAAPDTWEFAATYTTDQVLTLDDGADNQIIYYRIGVNTGDYVAGSIFMELYTSTGGGAGVVRVTNYVSSTVVGAEVLNQISSVPTSTDLWSEGAWSKKNGYPTSVVLHEGRLWWAGRDGVWGSVSDAYLSFDQLLEGDSGPIIRTIGSGPVDTINWMLSLQRLMIGSEGTELSCRSSSLDEPLTPTNFNMKTISTQGTAPIQAVKIDGSGVFIQRGNCRVFEINFNPEIYDYSTRDLTALVPEMGLPGIVHLIAQRQPDTRLHCLRSDGTVMLGIFDRNEDVLCWCDIETDGKVLDAIVLPSGEGSSEDNVYYLVERILPNNTVGRYLEKWAQEIDCRGGTLNKQADSFVEYSLAVPATTLTGLSHLEGEEVVVWADGRYLGDYTVSGGEITGLSSAVTNAIVGLPYVAQWKSGKQGKAVNEIISPLTAKKTINKIGLIMAWVHAKGLKYGPDFVNMDDLPEMEGYANVGVDEIREAYDEDRISFPGEWLTDARLCLQAEAPKPCTLLAAVIDMSMS